MVDGFEPRSDDSWDREADRSDAAALDLRDVFTRDLDLPCGLERERVHVHAQQWLQERNCSRSVSDGRP